jgi:hypothetical protein
MAAKLPLLKRASGAALVAVDACVITAGIEAEGREDSNLPPCKEVAGDPVGSCKPATARGGGQGYGLCNNVCLPSDVSTFEVSSGRNGPVWRLVVG